MKHRIAVVLALAATLLAAGDALAQTAVPSGTPGAIRLPGPDTNGKVTLEQAIARRRSVREFAPGPLTLAEVSQLMWVSQGITGPDGKRATPSARAVYPLQAWLVANDVKGLAPGIYRYEPREHALVAVATGIRDSVVTAARGQAAVKAAAAVVAVIGDSALAAAKFRGNAERWLGMEAGFIVQDVYLECTALGLGTVMVGGFLEPAARVALGTPPGWQVLALMPVGRKK